MKYKIGKTISLFLIVTLLFTFFSAAPVYAANDASITIDMNAPDGISTLELGVTQTHKMWDKGTDPTAVETARNLLKGTVKYNNQAIMGWGAEDPEPVKGTFNWTSLDDRVANMRLNGGEMVLTFCSAPGWMKTDSASETDIANMEWNMNARVTDAHVQDFAELCAAIAARYTDVKYFQVWNEMKGYWSNDLNNWDYIRYTNLYNAVYEAVKAVRPDAKVGGYYLPISGDGAASIGKEGNNTYDPFPEGGRDRTSLDYWLENKAGADFIAMDRWLTDWNGADPDWSNNTDKYTQEEITSLTYTYARAIEYVRTQTHLPIWFSEYYTSIFAEGGSQFVASAYASIYYNMIKGAINTAASSTPNDIIALLWNPMEGEDYVGGYLFTSTSVAGGAQTTPHYTVYKNVQNYFGRGAQLYKATSSNPMIEVLASKSKIMIINKYSTAKNVVLNGNDAFSLAPFEVKFIDPPGNLILNGGFEDGTTGWTFTGDHPPFASTDGNKTSGYKALNYWLQNPQVSTAQTTVKNCAAGTYSLSLWEKGGGQYNSAHLQVYAGDTLLQEADIVPTDAFGKVTIDKFVVPAATDLTIKISIDAISNLWLYIDDVTLTAVDPFELKPAEVSTFFGTAPAMPAFVDAVYDDGRTVQLPVTWDSIDPASYKSIGSFTVNGTVDGAKSRATATVNVLPIDAPPFVVTSGGTLDQKSGIKAVVTVERKEGTIDHAGNEVVVFQLMKWQKSFDIIALEKDITGKDVFTVYFDVPNPEKDAYSVKVFVFETFNSDTSVPENLANALTIK